uniref:TGF-beta family profile domain-containing protein n=1 Tax=Ditylenchus dipsaci TaxID=166011 RepID=A0A915D672_9BILA
MRFKSQEIGQPTYSSNLRVSKANSKSQWNSRSPTRWSVWLVTSIWIPLAILPSITTANLQHYTREERYLVQSLFLKKFGLEALTEQIQGTDHQTINQPTQMPAYLWDLYNQVDQGEADSIRHYYPSRLDRTPHGWLLTYNLTAVGRQVDRERVLRADLRLPLRLQPCNGTARLKVIEVGDGRRVLDTRRIQSKMLSKTNHWTDFDVSEALTRRRNNMDVVSFIVEHSSGEPQAQPIPVDLQQSAALVVFVENLEEGSTPASRRTKRSIIKAQRKHRKHRKHHSSKENTQCRRTELYVDFAELNWQDWIMAPVGYEAYQCRGRCPHPLPSQLNTTNHAIIQSLINSIDPSAVPPRLVYQ